MTTTLREQVQVYLGQAGQRIGTLVYARQGRREHCAFAYTDDWLANTEQFTVSADLPLISGYQPHKAVSREDSVFHGALADTAPDAWGRRVIARHHAKQRRHNPQMSALSEMDYLLAVDDFSRMGALRLRDAQGRWCASVDDEGQRRTPPLIDLARIYEASRFVEQGQETAADLRYLQGKGTSLGGMRPKCSVVDEAGRLAIGKFPSVADTRSVTRCEVLALKLAALAGIETPAATIVDLDGAAVAVIYRFDRDPEGKRIPYQSAASMLMASRHEDRSYLEIVNVLRTCGVAPQRDIHALWRRLVFNVLITNVDDHLQNHGFLHVGHGLWRLSPVFDINPFPDKERESKVWLSEQDGPIVDVGMLLARAADFALTREQALSVVSEVVAAVTQWRQVALMPEVGLPRSALGEIAPAFEHAQLEEARSLAEITQSDSTHTSAR